MLTGLYTSESPPTSQIWSGVVVTDGWSSVSLTEGNNQSFVVGIKNGDYNEK